MIKRLLVVSPLLNILVFSFAFTLTAAGASYVSFGALDGGGSTAEGNAFKSQASAGGSALGNAAGADYRAYSGVLGSSVKVIDAVISFSDESPSSTEVKTLPVTVKITVESEGNSIESAKYRISNSGSGEDSFLDWRDDVTVDPSFPSTSTKKRYMATIPNTAGDRFLVTDNNYIQWKARNSGGAEYISGKYRVRISTNDVPRVAILQPDEKGGIAGTEPLIYAFMYDQSGGIDNNAVQIRIDNNTTGENVAIINSATTPGIVTSSGTAWQLYYRYDRAPLKADVSYKMTISATDMQGTSGSASVVFTPKGGAIADLVPYPSPFDPKIRPLVIRYVLNRRSTVSVSIYDMSGRMVRNIVDGQSRDAGVNEDSWNGTDFSGSVLANGVYFCEIVAKDADGEHRRYTSLAIFGK